MTRPNPNKAVLGATLRKQIHRADVSEGASGAAGQSKTGEHRLLLDRYLGTLDVGLARDVEQLLHRAAEELQAGVRAWRECEQELLEQLTALLDVALWVVRELAP